MLYVCNYHANAASGIAMLHRRIRILKAENALNLAIRMIFLLRLHMVKTFLVFERIRTLVPFIGANDCENL